MFEIIPKSSIFYTENHLRNETPQQFYKSMYENKKNRWETLVKKAITVDKDSVVFYNSGTVIISPNPGKARQSKNLKTAFKTVSEESLENMELEELSDTESQENDNKTDLYTVEATQHSNNLIDFSKFVYTVLNKKSLLRQPIKGFDKTTRKAIKKFN